MESNKSQENIIDRENPENISGQNYDSNSPILIQKYCGEFHFWKIVGQECPLTPDRNAKLNTTIEAFIKEFFSITRADTKDLRGLVLDFSKAIKSYIKNLNINEDVLVGKFIEEFNILHSEISDYQISITADILTGIKRTCSFMQVYKRFFAKDQQLEEEEYRFKEKMFEVKQFTKDDFVETFFGSSLRDFIIGLDVVIERKITDLIDKNMRVFDHRCKKSVEKAYKSIIEFLTDLINQIFPFKVSVFISAIHSAQGEEGERRWELVYEDFIDREPVVLRQVVHLDTNHHLVTVGLINSKALMIISLKNFQGYGVAELFPDDRTLIASGSVVNAIILMQESLKKVHAACFSDERILLKKEINVYDETVEEIVEACLIRSTKELIVLYRPGGLRRISLDNKPLDPLNVHPVFYRSISISDCRRFVILFGAKAVFLYTYTMKHILNEDIDAACVGFTNNVMEIMILGENLKTEVREIKIDPSKIIVPPEILDIDEIVHSEGLRTIQLFKELIGGFLPKNRVKK